MLKTKKQIEKWLDKHEVTNYTINDDLTVDVNGTVNLSNKNLTRIPIQFNIVNGSFWCHYNKLTSLIGCFEIVKGNFSCSNNKLTSLIGSPEIVKYGFYCIDNKLTSLKHLPEFSGELVCDDYLHETREYKVYEISKKLREMV